MAALPYPERPVITPMLWAFLLSALVCSVVLRSDDHLLPWIYGVLAVILGSFALLAWRLREARGLFGLLASVMVVALLLSMCARHQAQDAQNELTHVPISKLTFETLSESLPSTQGYRTSARVVLPSGCQATCWLLSTNPLDAGCCVEGVGRFNEPKDDFLEFCRARGLAGTVTLLTTQRSQPSPGIPSWLLRWRASRLHTWNSEVSDEHALIAAMVTGSRASAQSRGVMDLCSQIGISHLVAVSGAHLALMASLLSAVLAKLPVGRKASFLVQAVLGLAYVGFCGSPPSAIRAWSMAQVSTGAGWRGRKSSSLNALGCVSCFYCLSDPFVTGDLGFLLSVASVGSMVLFGPWLRAVLSRLTPSASGKSGIKSKMLHGIVQQVGQASQAGFLCFCATAFLVAATFSRISLIGPVVSALLSPLFSPLMLLGLGAIATASIPVVGAVFDQIASLLSAGFLGIVRIAAKIPGTSISLELEESVAFLVTGGLLVTFLVLWPQPSRKTLVRLGGAGLCISLALLLSPLAAPAQLAILDVGQGDAILVREGSRAILVDTGPDDSIIGALQRQNVRSLDAVILTHQHDDHYGGLKALTSSIPVKSIFVAAGAQNALTPELRNLISHLGCPVEELSYQDEIQLGSWTLHVLWPQALVDGTENGHSLCLKVSCQEGITALITGDAEQEELAHFLDEAGTIDVLKVGHHGSAVSITKEEALAIQPCLAVASAGAHNRYGHPSEECQDVFKEVNVPFLCTKDTGDVVVEGKTAGSNEPDVSLRVHCQRAAVSLGIPEYASLDAVA